MYWRNEALSGLMDLSTHSELFKSQGTLIISLYYLFSSWQRNSYGIFILAGSIIIIIIIEIFIIIYNINKTSWAPDVQSKLGQSQGDVELESIRALIMIPGARTRTQSCIIKPPGYGHTCGRSVPRKGTSQRLQYRRPFDLFYRRRRTHLSRFSLLLSLDSTLKSFIG